MKREIAVQTSGTFIFAPKKQMHTESSVRKKPFKKEEKYLSHQNNMMVAK
jgi:malate synthase